MDAITGYEEYEQDFRLVSLPEYCWMAGQLLIEALEDYQPPENLAVYMPECLCRELSGYTFLFQAHMEDNKKGYSLLYIPYCPCRPVPCLPAGCPAVSYPADCRNQLAGSVPFPDSTGHKYPLPVIQHGRGRAGVSYSSSSVLAIPQGRSKAAHPPPKAGKDGVGKQVV